MGLRTGGCYAKIWKIERNERYTKVQASISKKDKATGNYETDWSGFINFVGQAHTEIAKYKEGDRVKIEEFEVTTSYNKDKKVTYTNYSVFKISDAANSISESSSPKKPAPDEMVEVSEDGLPF
jgi:hypothetical protein